MNTPDIQNTEQKAVFISVVVPTYHRNDLLAQCLDCLRPGVQLLEASQYEVIVTDDGSKTTAQAMIGENYPWARWVAGPRKGPAANRNHGAQQARGTWLAFTDDDCLPETQWLSAFAAQTSGEMTTASVLEGKTTTEQSKGLFYIAPANLTGGYLWSCNMMIARQIFDEMGGFDVNFPFPALEDVEFHRRLKDGGHQIKFVPQAVVFHPLRPVVSILSQIRAHESSWYMSRKHKIPLRDFQMHPVFYWKSQIRQILKNARSPSEMLRFFLTRSCVEAFSTTLLAFRWNRKYKS